MENMTGINIEEVKKYVSRGEKVALLCYNSLLANWLQYYFSRQSEALHPVYVGTLHGYLMKIVQQKHIRVAFPDSVEKMNQFFAKELPAIVSDVFKSEGGVFDRVIIDEAQDLMSEEYLICIDTMLKKGIARGKWDFFGDFNKQAIYTKDMVESDFMDMLEERTSYIRYKLTTNCRNTQYICDQIKIVTGFTKDIADMNHVDKDRLYQAFIDEENQREGAIEITEDMTEDEYRLEEYKVLIKNSGNDVEDFHSINYPIENYNPVIRKYFKSISLVPKLKETRAFVGFSRLDAPNRRVSESKKELRLGNEEWLPAIEVYGEGIFFEFNEEKLTEWANKPNVKERIDILNRSYHNAKFGINDSGNLRPEFILIHTFSHLLINQLSFDCGYGSSSIRERIYCEKTSNDLKMYGLLLYTASGDSEGSLGGLVRQGETGRIEDTILSAMENASWCTSDPVCIQSAGQGPESLNLAACHNCTLLPETCCEVGNRLLDRGTVVGTLSDKQIGFFADIIHAEGE